MSILPAGELTREPENRFLLSQLVICRNYLGRSTFNLGSHFNRSMRAHIWRLLRGTSCLSRPEKRFRVFGSETELRVRCKGRPFVARPRTHKSAGRTACEIRHARYPTYCCIAARRHYGPIAVLNEQAASFPFPWDNGQHQSG
jgi:hypothetical protein